MPIKKKSINTINKTSEKIQLNDEFSFPIDFIKLLKSKDSYTAHISYSINSGEWLSKYKSDILSYLYSDVSRGSKYIFRDKMSLKYIEPILKKLEFSEPQIRKILSLKKNFAKKFKDNLKEISEAIQKPINHPIFNFQNNPQKDLNRYYNKDMFDKEMQKVKK